MRLFLTKMQITQMMMMMMMMKDKAKLVVGDESGNIAIFDVQTAQCVERKQVCGSVGKRERCDLGDFGFVRILGEIVFGDFGRRRSGFNGV